MHKDVKIWLPIWANAIDNPAYRFVIYLGGRNSMKSYTIASKLIELSMQKKIKVLCGREFQQSLDLSVHSLLKSIIYKYGLEDYFRILKNKITCSVTNSEFIFQGFGRNVEKIKSIPEMTHVWIEEADVLSMASWEVIEPTVRDNHSQIIVSFNPKYATDCVYQLFIASSHLNYCSFVHKSTWRDNPFLTETSFNSIMDTYNKDRGKYMWIYEGELLENSKSQVFFREPKKLWYIDEFKEPKDVDALYGMDFGYTVDPTTCVRSYIIDNTLYITHEVYQKALEIDHIADFCKERIPDFDCSKIIGDTAAPDVISYLRRHGTNIIAAKKGPGSVEAGIALLRSFDKIVIHPRCKHTIDEFTLYSYKVDPRSGIISNVLDDKAGNDHIIDALRYSIEHLITKPTANYANMTMF